MTSAVFLHFQQVSKVHRRESVLVDGTVVSTKRERAFFFYCFFCCEIVGYEGGRFRDRMAP